MTTTTEQLAAALRAVIAGTPDDLEAAAALLARYDAERAEQAPPELADSASMVASAFLLRFIEAGEFVMTGDPVIIEDADDDDARTYGVPVLIRIAAADVEPGEVDDDTRSNGPRV